MGLDMYLSAEKYINGYEFADEEERALYRTLVAEFGAEWADPETPTGTVSISVAYWRKANQIHRWFVENVQDNVDDCREYEVSREQLRELQSLCAEALAVGEPAAVLPTQEGFFFGGTEYDKWYRADLESTIAQIDRALLAPEDWYFQYRSSW